MPDVPTGRFRPLRVLRRTVVFILTLAVALAPSTAVVAQSRTAGASLTTTSGQTDVPHF